MRNPKSRSGTELIRQDQKTFKLVQAIIDVLVRTIIPTTIASLSAGGIVPQSLKMGLK